MDKQTADRRIRKTKKLLREALTELMNEKRIENITIKDLTEKANLNRGTFYLHYHDIYDLLSQSEDEVLEEIKIITSKFDLGALNEHNFKNKPFPPLVALLEYLADNMNFGKVLMGPKGSISFLEKLTAILKNQFKKWVSIYKKKNDIIFNEYFIDFSIFGFIGIIKKWFESDLETSPKELAVIIVKIISNLA